VAPASADAPAPLRFRFPGRKSLDSRRVFTGILFVLKTGIAWDALPTELASGCGQTGAPTPTLRRARRPTCGHPTALQTCLLLGHPRRAALAQVGPSPRVIHGPTTGGKISHDTLRFACCWDTPAERFSQGVPQAGDAVRGRAHQAPPHSRVMARWIEVKEIDVLNLPGSRSRRPPAWRSG
jgi:hypothetical protein